MRKQRSDRLGLLAGGEDLEEAFGARHGNELGSQMAEVRRDGLVCRRNPRHCFGSRVRYVRCNNESLGGKRLI